MAKKKMDKLSQEVAQALACGMSYGKWKALQPIATIEKPEIPEGWRACEYCGKGFKPIQGKRFCDIECRQKAYKEKESKIKAAYYRARKEALKNEGN